MKDNENEADESSADEAVGKEFGRGAHKQVQETQSLTPGRHSHDDFE